MFLLMSLRWNLLGSLLGTCTFAPKYPLERNVWDPKLFRSGHDQPCHVRGKLLSMRPFLYCCLSYGTAERGGELAVAQRDAVPRAEHVQQHGEATRHRDSFRSSFGLDR